MSRRNETRRNTHRRRRFEGTGHMRYGSDSERLDSFREWTGPLNPNWLVNVGFSYTGVADAVRCFSCNVVIQNWTKDMDPLVTHVQRAPHCRQLLRLIPFDVLAEMKDQNFDNKNMIVPFNGAVKWPCNHFTGTTCSLEMPPITCLLSLSERVDGDMHDSFHVQPHHPSAGRNGHHPGHGDSNTEAVQSIVMFSEGPKGIREMDIQEGRGDVHPNVGLPVDNTAISGELNAGMDVANGVVMDDELNSAAAQTVLQTGYGIEGQVKNAIIDLRRNGKHIFNGSDILEKILETESQVRPNRRQ